MHQPMVSVVMPSLNQAQFIDEAIDSVLTQSYQYIELIVADGGSTDGTQQILAAWRARDTRLRWTSAPDSGPADAINNALKRVRGTLVGWLNSDDLYTAGAVARAAEVLTNDAMCLMVYGHGQHVDHAGRFLNQYPTLPPSAGLRSFAHGCFICQPTVFFRRSMVLLLGEFDTTLKTAFDFDYWLRAFGAFEERIRFLDAVRAKSRLHGACITSSMRRTVALEGARLVRHHLGTAPFNWLLDHFKEVKKSGMPDLQRYWRLVIEDARPYFSAEEVEVLRLSLISGD